MLSEERVKALICYLSIIVILWIATTRATQWPLLSSDLWINTYGEFQRFRNPRDQQNDMIYLHNGLDIYHNVGTPVRPVSAGYIRKAWICEDYVSSDPLAAQINHCIVIEDADNSPDQNWGWEYGHLDIQQLRKRALIERPAMVREYV